MRERRFLVPEIEETSEVHIRGDEAHHLLHVLRLREGDEIVVFDGRGRHFRAVIAGCHKASAHVRILGALPTPESAFELWVAVAVPKGDKMATIIRMLTELGVHGLIPLVSERTVVGAVEDLRRKFPRWRRIAREACKQSGRSRTPKLEEPLLFGELLERELSPDRLLVCPGGAPLALIPRLDKCLAVVGPEGGWTREEMTRAQQKGLRKVGLGQRILRTDTAAVTIAAILQAKCGDL